MSYRPSYAGFELNVGSVLGGVIPAAAMSGAIGSFLIMTYVVGSEIIRSDDSLSLVLGTSAVALFLGTFFGTIIGSIMCAFYIAITGVPVAILLGPRIERPVAGAVAVVTAIGTGIAATLWMVDGIYGVSMRDFAPLLGAAMAYAIPAGLLYRRAIITSRKLSPWAN